MFILLVFSVFKRRKRDSEREELGEKKHAREGGDSERER